MRLLLDSDALCQLAIANVLEDAAQLLGTNLASCERLPDLPYMLRRGSLRRRLGAATSDRLIPIVDALPVLDRPGDAWLDRLTPIDAIDPGEAQLLARAAEAGLTVVSGDKRALRALREVPGFAELLEGRIVIIEALLLALCDRLGTDEVRRRTSPLESLNKLVQVCFSTGNPTPEDGLLSYYNSSAAELAPLVLWNPRPEGAA